MKTLKRISIGAAQIECFPIVNILSVGVDIAERPCIWAIVDTSKEMKVYPVWSLIPGDSLERVRGKYVGVYYTQRGRNVFHVFVGGLK